MPKFCANLTMLYTEHAFLDRFAAAARDGFKASSSCSPTRSRRSSSPRRSRRTASTQVLHNLPAGDWDEGERGIACQPDRVGEFRRRRRAGDRLRDGARLPAGQLPGRASRPQDADAGAGACARWSRTCATRRES